MSYDPQLYYNPEAQPLPVIHEDDSVLDAYDGTRADDDGTVIGFPGDNNGVRGYFLELL